MADLERDLTAVMRRCKRTEEAHEQNLSERDRIIRDAYEARVPRAKIVEITGLSPQRIDQIRRGSRI